MAGSMRIDRSSQSAPLNRCAPFRVATDPMPTDALCVCGCGRARPAIAVKHEDPFATTDCARAYYDAPRS